MFNYKQCELLLEKLSSKAISQIFNDLSRFPETLMTQIEQVFPNFPTLHQFKEILDRKEMSPDAFVDKLIEYLSVVPSIVPASASPFSMEAQIRIAAVYLHDIASKTARVVRLDKDTRQKILAASLRNSIVSAIQSKPSFITKEQVIGTTYFDSHGIPGKINPT